MNISCIYRTHLMPLSSCSCTHWKSPSNIDHRSPLSVPLHYTTLLVLTRRLYLKLRTNSVSSAFTWLLILDYSNGAPKPLLWRSFNIKLLRLRWQKPHNTNLCIEMAILFTLQTRFMYVYLLEVGLDGCSKMCLFLTQFGYCQSLSVMIETFIPRDEPIDPQECLRRGW